MTKFILSLAAAVALSIPSLALACPGHAHGEGGCPHAKTEGGCPHHAKAAKEGEAGGCACEHEKEAHHASKWKEISVDELASLGKGKVTIFDVNNDKVRSDKGVIPGAVLLASSSQYDLSVLPKDKAAKLVFYCANTRCTAAPTAAERAIGAGYTDVSVLHVGIAGWKEAGKKTDTPRS